MFRHFIRDLSMIKKLIISFFLVVAIPVAVSIFLTFSMRQITMDNAMEQANFNVGKINAQISELLSSIVSISDQISLDSNLLTTLSTDYSSNYDMIVALWKNANLNNTLVSYKNKIDGMHFYVDSKFILSTGLIGNTPDYIRKTDWYKKASAGKLKPFWIYLDNDSYAKRNIKNLALCRPVYVNGRVFGVLVIYVSNDFLSTITQQLNFETILCSPQDTIVVSSDAALLGKSLASLGLAAHNNESAVKVNYNGEKTNIITKNLSINSTDGAFTIMSLFSDDEILGRTSKVTNEAFAIVVVGIAISVFSVIVFSGLLTRRLAKVSRDIHRAASGDFRFTPNEDGKDEIGLLSRDLCHMLGNINSLIAEVYEAKIQKQELESRQKDIQLQVLNSQINPHFFFNSLESIRMKAIVNGDDNIASVVRDLSALMRKSLYTGNAPIPLSEEINLIRNYLEVQKFRFDERLQYSIDLFTEVGNQTILPFTLQPIVENAVRHGIEEADNPGFNGFVSVSIMKEDDKLILRVADNGIGIEPDGLERIRNSLKCPESDYMGHIGLINVNHRIMLNYGQEYGLMISSVKGNGTVVTILLPATH